jgi:hypothetical protein
MRANESDVFARYIPMFDTVIVELGKTFRVLEKKVPLPVLVPYHGGLSPRYLEKTAQQAIIQKLARYLSGLTALRLLVQNGLTQEQGTLQRTLDEIGEDILFLTAKPTAADDQAMLQRYLDMFYMEEIEENVSPMISMRRRDQIPRSKIRKFISRQFPLFAGDGERAGSAMSQAYSGFIHASSPHLMELCNGPNKEFSLMGTRGVPLMISYIDDAWNYYIRGISICGLAAADLKDLAELDRMKELAAQTDRFIRVR